MHYTVYMHIGPRLLFHFTYHIMWDLYVDILRNKYHLPKFTLHVSYYIVQYSL